MASEVELWRASLCSVMRVGCEPQCLHQIGENSQEHILRLQWMVKATVSIQQQFKGNIQY